MSSQLGSEALFAVATIDSMMFGLSVWSILQGGGAEIQDEFLGSRR